MRSSSATSTMPLTAWWKRSNRALPPSSGWRRCVTAFSHAASGTTSLTAVARSCRRSWTSRRRSCLPSSAPSRS
eukprot:11283922-Prorocentrum_lima.AAC.1